MMQLIIFYYQWLDTIVVRWLLKRTLAELLFNEALWLAVYLVRVWSLHAAAMPKQTS